MLNKFELKKRHKWKIVKKDGKVIEKIRCKWTARNELKRLKKIYGEEIRLEPL